MDQVTTFFHEVGHLLHHLFSTHRFHGFAGIACEWDFVEVPSQLYEEWGWSAGVLQRFATHHETGAPIPEALVNKLRAAEEFGKGMNVMGQMLYALFALTLYDRDPAGVDPGELLGSTAAGPDVLREGPGDRDAVRLRPPPRLLVELLHLHVVPGDLEGLRERVRRRPHEPREGSALPGHGPRSGWFR